MSLKVPPQIATGFSDRLQGSFERWLFYRAQLPTKRKS